MRKWEKVVATSCQDDLTEQLEHIITNSGQYQDNFVR